MTRQQPEPVSRAVAPLRVQCELSADDRHRGVVAYLDGDRVVLESLGPVLPRFPLPPPLALVTPSDAAISRALNEAHTARARDLHNLWTGAGPVSRGPRQTPKDGSAQIQYLYTRCIGAPGQMITDLASVASREGFRLVVETDGLDAYGIPAAVRQFIDEASMPQCFRTGAGDRARVAGKTVTQFCSSWAEDDGEIAADGAISIPATTLTEGGNSLAVSEDRDRREVINPDKSKVGAVAEGFRQYFKARLALSIQPARPLRENIAHIEGGNMLPGVLPNGDPFVYLGKDSFAATLHTICEDLDLDLTFPDYEAKYRALEGVAKAAIAYDFDLPSPDHVFLTEQASYHLDVYAFLNGHHLVIDDPVEALNVELDWEGWRASEPVPLGARSIIAAERYMRGKKEWDERQAELLAWEQASTPKAERRRKFLEPFIEDVRRVGGSIERFGGRFYESADKYNAMSNESGTNPAGERYAIVANTFVDTIRDHVLEYYLKLAPKPYKRVYLLDAFAAHIGKEEGGGISCRCKAQGKPYGMLPGMQALLLAAGLSNLA